MLKLKSLLLESIFADIDIIAKESKTKDEFIRKLKSYLQRNAEDKTLANDAEFIGKLASEYFGMPVESVKEASGFGAYRRIVITSPTKIQQITDEINALISKPEFKHDYPVKLVIKKSVKPNTIVVDVEGQSATAVAAKIKDVGNKLDKSVVVKIKKERPLVVKEISKSFVKSKKIKEKVDHSKIDAFIDFCNVMLSKGKTSFNNALTKEMHNVEELNDTEFELAVQQAKKDGYILSREPDNYQTTSYYFEEI